MHTVRAYPILGIWYWCTDQTIVQRVLGARSVRDAQLGPIFAGYLKFLPMFLLVLPGVFAYVLFRNQIGTDSNATLPVLIENHIPAGLRGLISAAVLAALMSAVSAALNSSGTLLAIDLAKRVRPSMSDRQVVTVGRVSSALVMILAILWSTQGARFTSIFAAINIIASDLAPPITTVFLFGVFWKRGTKQASIVTLLGGLCMGVAAFLVDLPVIGNTRLLSDFFGISFLMQAWWMFCVCSIVFVVVSLMTPAPQPEEIEGLTWPNPIAVLTRKPIRGFGAPRIMAMVLLVVLAMLYALFR